MMSSIEQGLRTGSDVLMWLLNILGAVIGFLLPFIAVGFILFLLAIPIMIISEKTNDTK